MPPKSPVNMRGKECHLTHGTPCMFKMPWNCKEFHRDSALLISRDPGRKVKVPMRHSPGYTGEASKFPEFHQKHLKLSYNYYQQLPRHPYNVPPYLEISNKARPFHILREKFHISGWLYSKQKPFLTIKFSLS